MAKKQKAKGRKIGRNAARCKAYRASRTRERNKIVNLTKLIALNPNDRDAREALTHYKSGTEGNVVRKLDYAPNHVRIARRGTQTPKRQQAA